jgi:hypothetical protein
VSYEALTAIATVGTLVVIAASAIAAFVQLRHLRSSNAIAALTECREILESEDFARAQRFVAHELPALLKDPNVRRELLQVPLPEHLRSISVIGNFFESLGAFVRHDIVDKEIALSLWSGVVHENWEQLSPALAIMRRKGGPTLWEQFEYMASISKGWLDRHEAGDYPPGVAHLSVEDVWLKADQSGEAIS